MLNSLSHRPKSGSRCPFATGKFSLEDFQRALQKHPDNPFQALQDLHAEQGETFEFSTPEGDFIFDHDPNTAKKLITRTEGKDPIFKKSSLQTHGLAEVLGDENVLLSSGEQWQASREALEPFFASRNVKTPHNTKSIARILDKHFDPIDKLLDNQESVNVDLDELFQKATLDVALNHMFGVQPSAEELTKLGKAYDTLNERVGQEWLIPASLSGIEEPGSQFQEARRFVGDYAANIVDDRLQTEERPDDALSALMTATDPDTDQPFSRERLVSEVQNLMLAGHETTANLLSWTISDLARSPQKQNKLVADIQEVTGGDEPEARELTKLQSVLKTWRQQAVDHPPNYLLARVALEDTTVGSEENPVEVKAGTTVMVSTQDANDGRNMFSFGGGPRFCLGFNLARLETEMAIARFLQRFEVSDTGPQGVQSALAQAPADTLVTVKRRVVNNLAAPQ